MAIKFSSILALTLVAGVGAAILGGCGSSDTTPPPATAPKDPTTQGAPEKGKPSGMSSKDLTVPGDAPPAPKAGGTGTTS